MFTMAKEELVARLQGASDIDLSEFGDNTQGRKLFLLTQAGMMSCSDIALRSYEEVLEKAKEEKQLNLLDLALAAPLPGNHENEKVKKTFLYCVDVDFLPNSGGNPVGIPAICIDLDSVFGFSLGNLEVR